MVIAGASCKDLSSCKAQAKAGVLCSGEGTSSLTMNGLLAYCAVHFPWLISLENVWNIIHCGNFVWVRARFRRIGYQLFFCEQNPLGYRIPTSRHRAYFWGFLIKGSEWFVIQEAGLLQGYIHDFICRLKAPEDAGLLHVCDFLTGVPEWDQCDRDAVGQDSNVDCPKWPPQHAAFVQEHGLGSWPIMSSAYRLPEATMFAAFPTLARLPLRELDWAVSVDKLLCELSGSGQHNGKDVFGDLSQALQRGSFKVGHLPCILPGGKLLDFARASILSGTHRLRLQGIVDTVDYKLDYSVVSDNIKCDLSGNAMSGWCFATSLLVQMATSHTRPSRICKKLSFPVWQHVVQQDQQDEVVALSRAKRHKPDSGLGLLLSIC